MPACLNKKEVDSFIKQINEYNIKFIENQKKNINEVLNIVNNNKHIKNNPTLFQIETAKKWCNKYNLPINNHIIVE